MKFAEAGEEGLQQLTQNIVDEVAKSLSGIEADFSPDTLGEGVWDSFWKTLWSGIGAGSPTIRFGLDAHDARKAYLRDTLLAEAQDREQSIFQDLDALSQDSELASRDPLLYEDAVRTLAQGSPLERVYIPASGLATAYGEHQDALFGALESLGVSQQEYAEMLAQGGDLEIAVEKYASAVAANKEFAALIADHRRLTPDGFTRQELHDFHKARQDEMQRLLDDIASDKEAKTQLEQESREIHWAVRQMLEAAGQSSEGARANAAQTTAVFATLAQRSKGQYSPRQLWDMYAPDMVGPDGKVYAAREAWFPSLGARRAAWPGMCPLNPSAQTWRPCSRGRFPKAQRSRRKGKLPLRQRRENRRNTASPATLP
jgi:hypothetical protein